MTAAPHHFRTTQHLAWQGWGLSIPDTWNPVRVDGDYDEGSLLLADLHAPRLGLRWKRWARRSGEREWAERSLREEVGSLAANEARDIDLPHADFSVGRLYTEPNPPGRDVFVGHGRLSGRMMQVVHHASGRSVVFRRDILPTLTDTAASAPHHWAVFDLSLLTPPGVRVQWYRFNAGDLSLGLADATKTVTVIRQIGPATLALARQPLRGWLTQQQQQTRKLYRPIGQTEPTALERGDRTLDGLRGVLHRKRRLWWAWMVERKQVVLAFHDPLRYRLVMGQSPDEPALRELLATVGSGPLSRVFTGEG